MLAPHEALRAWNLDTPVSPTPDPGLINRTYLVGNPPTAVLQWVNPIFDPAIHHDIAALTERLAASGLATPTLQPTVDGSLWLDDAEGCWRLQSFVPGVTIHRLEGTARAFEAGALVGRFHAALDGWSHRFVAPRRDIHDTPARMAELRQALEGADGHPLAQPTRDLGAAVLEAWDRWLDSGARHDTAGDDSGGDDPERPCHGDLKVSNLRFDAQGRGVCLIDLDTVGPMALTSELGDAWRSWCNPVPEDRADEARFDLDLFAASARGWLSTGPALSIQRRRNLVPAIERIALELAARFAADAVRNTYFREDRERFPQLGQHNLLKARGQLAFARSARSQRHAALQHLT